MRSRKDSVRILAWVVLWPALVFGQSQKPLTNTAVIEMVKAGFRESVILKAIEANDTAFDISAQALIELKDAGVSENVIEAMLSSAARKGQAGSTPTAGQPTQDVSEQETTQGPGEQSPVDQSPRVVIRRPDLLATPREDKGQTSGVFRVGGGVSAPQVIRKVDPDYKRDAREAKCQGTVVLDLVVRRDGTTGDVQVERDNITCEKFSDDRVTRALAIGLSEKATEAVKQWRFRPGMKEGQPVDVEAVIEVTFRLR